MGKHHRPSRARRILRSIRAALPTLTGRTPLSTQTRRGTSAPAAGGVGRKAEV